MSVDVDAGESTVYFDLLGDIYRLPINGGHAERVLGGEAFEMQPVLSPDDQHLAFIGDRSGSENLWIADLNGQGAKRLSADTDKTEYSSPAWSPDGRYVYVSRRPERLGVFEIWRFDVAGGSGERVAPDADNDSLARSDRVNALGPAVSPDGRFLYYATKTGEPWDHIDNPTWRIERLDLTEGSVQTVVGNGLSAMRPALSSDGGQLVYAARRDAQTGLRLRDLRTGADRWLAIPVERDNQDGGYSRDLLPRYDWLPASNTLLATIDGKLWRMAIGNRSRTPVPFEAKVALEVGPPPKRELPAETGPVRARLVQAPAVSPDGASVAFSALGKLYVQDLPDGTPRQVTDGTDFEFQPAWTPDGKMLVYVTGSANGSHLWRVRVGRTGSARRLTPTAAHYTEPVVSPDGRSVYLLQSSHFDRMLRLEEVGPDREAMLVRVPIDGGPPEPVAFAGTHPRRPHFVLDDPRIYLTNSEGLASIDPRNGSQKTHFRVEGPYPWNHRHEKPVPMEDVRLSPDGRWALVRAGHQLLLLARPAAQAETPVVNLLAPPTAYRKQVSRIGADYFAWADGGRRIVWAIGSTLFSRTLGEDGKLGETESVDIQVEHPRDVHRATVVLRGATVLTMRGDEVVTDADIVISGNRIADVGPRGTVAAVDNAQVVDMSGRYILPGFVDTHAHWYEVRRDVLVAQQWSYLMSLAYGITAGLDVQGMDQDMFAYQDLIDAGLMLGPRAYSVGKGMFSDNRFDSYEGARTLLLRYRDYYRTHNVKAYLTGNRHQRRLIASAATELGMLATTEGNNDSKLDITHAIDGFGGNEHYPAMFPLRNDIVELFARSGIAYTPTLLLTSGGPAADDIFIRQKDWHSDPKVRRFMPHSVVDGLTTMRQYRRDDEQVYRIVAADARRIMQLGGRVGVGSHAQFQGVSFHWEMQGFADGGWQAIEILRAATIGGADIIGRAHELGSIEAGKLADLVVLVADPRDDIANTLAIEAVMKNGRLYDGDTLDEIWPRQRELPPLWFHNERIYP